MVVHPNDDGYKPFAAVCGTRSASWRPASSRRPRSPASTMRPPARHGRAPKWRAMPAGPSRPSREVGHDDGNYVHDRIPRGAIASARIDKGSDPQVDQADAIPAHMFFANIVVNVLGSDRALSCRRLDPDLSRRGWEEHLLLPAESGRRQVWPEQDL